MIANGQPKFGSAIQFKKNQHMCCSIRFPNTTNPALDELVEDREIGNATRVVPMAGL